MEWNTLADKQSILLMNRELKSYLTGYDRRYSSAHIWLCHISEPSVLWVILSWCVSGCRSVTVKRGLGGGCWGSEHTACYPDMRMSGRLHREEEELPTAEWRQRAQGQHDEWGRKAAGGHKSISPLPSSLLRWILPYTSSCPVVF